jgi:hypothetical protein
VDGVGGVVGHLPVFDGGGEDGVGSVAWFSDLIFFPFFDVHAFDLLHPFFLTQGSVTWWRFRTLVFLFLILFSFFFLLRLSRKGWTRSFDI